MKSEMFTGLSESLVVLIIQNAVKYMHLDKLCEDYSFVSDLVIC